MTGNLIQEAERDFIGETALLIDQNHVLEKFPSEKLWGVK